ncbi:ran GTPase-activating protein 1-like [Argiope bruennichi]|uniref:Ran GTPase-activating protein 1 like protein n=1 Tax=Argiope bruennichi TaxID=94029 RepID=A0A8T0ETR5_ARGBR|nr:ran GTPase-activating protein 1-like [Argiope bruennichi]KAF8778818.1 Ran GTPase-activating protein 1 like protein [Argiope bruennichi]
MASVDNLIEKLAAASVDEEDKDKEVSFVGKALTLDTEEDAAEIVKAIENCPGMTTLQLEGNTVGIPAAKAIGKALESQSAFKKALWKDMFTRRDKTEIPQALSHLSKGIMTANAKLVVLDLSDNAFGPRGLVGLQELLQSPCCYTLEELHFNNNGLGIQGARLLSESISHCIESSLRAGTPMKLKIFVCGRNRLENDGAIAVAEFLKELGTLESIAMPQNGIYSPGIKALADAFYANPKLKVINLEDNSLTEKGAQCIADCLPSLHHLQMLNLGDCLVRTGGALALANALEDGCPEIRNINLGFNEIDITGGEAIVGALAHKESLETIILNGNNFGEDGCQFIKDKMGELGKLEVLGSLSEDEGENDDDPEDDDDEDYEDIDEDDDDDDDDDDSQDESSRAMGDQTHRSPMSRTSHKSPMTKLSFADFLSNPTPETLVALHKAKEDVMSILPKDPTITDYLEVFLTISLVVTLQDDSAKTAASKYADDLLSKAYSLDSEDATDFNNQFLVVIGLLKGEDQKPKYGLDISGPLLVIEHAVKQPYFHASTRNLLQLFLSQPLQYVTAENKAKHVLMKTLYQC